MYCTYIGPQNIFLTITSLVLFYFLNGIKCISLLTFRCFNVFVSRSVSTLLFGVCTLRQDLSLHKNISWKVHTFQVHINYWSQSESKNLLRLYEKPKRNCGHALECSELYRLTLVSYKPDIRRNVFP